MSTNIAMWSGPRNISTAMMYCFGNRPDCVAWDEPFYAFSLVHHGNDHPMRDEIIAADDKDWDSLVAKCLGAAPKPVFYQKHMTANGTSWPSGSSRRRSSTWWPSSWATRPLWSTPTTS